MSTHSFKYVQQPKMVKMSTNHWWSKVGPRLRRMGYVRTVAGRDMNWLLTFEVFETENTTIEIEHVEGGIVQLTAVLY